MFEFLKYKKPQGFPQRDPQLVAEVNRLIDRNAALETQVAQLVKTTKKLEAKTTKAIAELGKKIDDLDVGVDAACECINILIEEATTANSRAKKLFCQDEELAKRVDSLEAAKT